MAQIDEYNYSVTESHIVPFVNPIQDEPFMKEMEGTYGKLWKFKEHIAN